MKDSLTHPFRPVYDRNSSILILGSFPSVKSRQLQFYYGHPQNRFWKVLSVIYEVPLPESIQDKNMFLHEHHIALWDIISSCSIEGSADATIDNVVVNDIASIIQRSSIERVYTNGSKAFELYNKYVLPKTGLETIRLPSTSPANAAFSLDRLVRSWQVIKG